MPGTDGERLLRGGEPQQALGDARHRARAEGQALALDLIAGCDILLENFKVGALARYGLGYRAAAGAVPGADLLLASPGSGRPGPYAARPGYDSLIQAMGGIMSLTGEPDGACRRRSACPSADLFAGLYGCIGVLAALRHRAATGLGPAGGHRDAGHRTWRGWRTRG